MFTKTRTHSVKFNGKTLEPVEVYDPKTLEDLMQLVKDKSETETSICQMYHNAKAVLMQAARRREQTSKSIPKADVNRIYATMPTEDILKYHKMVDGKMHLDNAIAEIYQQELIDAAKPEVEDDNPDTIDDTDVAEDES